MAIYPGAVFKPTAHGGRVKRNRQGRGMLHVAVSDVRSLPPSSGTTWHFYIAYDGYCEQYVDTDFRAFGGGDGNDDQIIVETAGGRGTSSVLNAQPWTPAQVARIADLMRWEASQPGGAPLELLPDARPGRRGWGPHRLGIKHSGGPRPGWWQPGSELWSNSLGKECPGDAKVRQIPEIIEMARTGLDAGDDMPTPREVEERAYIAGHNLWLDMNNIADSKARRAFLSLVAAALAPLQGQIAGLTQALTQVAGASGRPVDLDAVTKAAYDGAAKALAEGVEVDITVGGQAQPER